jgi:ankyrin repeat protein
MMILKQLFFDPSVKASDVISCLDCCKAWDDIILSLLGLLPDLHTQLLYRAVICKQSKIMKKLITVRRGDEYAAPLAYTVRNRDLLTTAVEMGCLEIVELLVRTLHANINDKKYDGATLLYRAANMGNCSVVSYLINAGADMYAKNGENENTALHIAVIADRSAVVKMLVEDFKMNVNVQNKKGSTPYHLAMIMWESSVTSYLRQHGADETIKDKEGHTPLCKGKFRDDFRYIKAGLKPLWNHCDGCT